MPPPPARRAPNRPPTLKEARRAYLKRGGSSYMSTEERQRLIRAQEREEQRLEKVKKEAARQEAAKKRAESTAKQREERRRLGLPDPTVKVSPGQMRIGGFLKGKEAATRLDEAQTTRVEEHEEVACPKRGIDDVQSLPLPAEEDGESPLQQEENYALGAGGEPVMVTEDYREGVSKHASATFKADATLPPADLRSSFFESNSQIEREMNVRVATSPIEQHFLDQGAPGQEDEHTSTPKATTSPHTQTLEAAEIENLLFGISSQELDCLSSSPPPYT